MEKMLQKMMKRYPVFIAMGFMIVVISVIIGATNTAAAASYYAVDKVTRETTVGWAQVRASIESTLIWLPYFKFLGIAMILGGITMALGVIATRLQDMGTAVVGNSGVSVPPRPRSVMFMRLFMMLGMVIILAGFVVALINAGTAAAVYSNPVTVLDAAPTGSSLLRSLASVHAAEAWLEALKFVGVAFLFLGIINGLSTIIFALQFQKQAIPQIVAKAPAPSVPAPAVGD